MNDAEILVKINALATEEQKLEEAHVGEGLSDAERERLRSIELTLDQLWDLLRQRRAKRESGRDSGEAEIRPPGTVEDYLQ
jgi:hypothetical protein